MPSEEEFIASLSKPKGKLKIPPLQATPEQLAKYPGPAAQPDASTASSAPSSLQFGPPAQLPAAGAGLIFLPDLIVFDSMFTPSSHVAVAGASGRMGRMLIEAIAASGDCQLTAALDQPQSPSLGQDAAAFLGQSSGVAIESDPAQCLGQGRFFDRFHPP